MCDLKMKTFLKVVSTLLPCISLLLNNPTHSPFCELPIPDMSAWFLMIEILTESGKKNNK